MNKELLNNFRVRVHIILAIVLNPLIYAIGQLIYQSYPNIMSATNILAISTVLMVISIIANFWRISVVNDKLNDAPQVIEEQVLSEEQQVFRETQDQMKKMNGSENMVENSEKKQTKIETVDYRGQGTTEKEAKKKVENLNFERDHEVEFQAAEEKNNIPTIQTSPAPSWKAAKPNVQIQPNEMFAWLEANPTKGVNDFKELKAEEARLIEIEKIRREEEEKKRAEEKQQDIIDEAVGKITTSDIRKVTEALIGHWIDQIKNNEVIIKPATETLQKMGVASWEVNGDNNNSDVKTSKPKKENKEEARFRNLTE